MKKLRIYCHKHNHILLHQSYRDMRAVSLDLYVKPCRECQKEAYVTGYVNGGLLSENPSFGAGWLESEGTKLAERLFGPVEKEVQP